MFLDEYKYTSTRIENGGDWVLTVKKEVPMICVAMTAVDDGRSRNEMTLGLSTLLVCSLGFPPKDILFLFLHFPS